MYRALRARWNERKRVRQREKDAVRGRDACYETTACESLEKRGEERREEESKARWTSSLRERAFIFYLASLSPFSPSITLCSLSPPLFLSRSAFLLFPLSLFFFHFFLLHPPLLSLSLSLSRLSPSSLLPLFPLLFSPFFSSATPLEPLRLAVIISVLAYGLK